MSDQNDTDEEPNQYGGGSEDVDAVEQTERREEAVDPPEEDEDEDEGESEEG